MIKPTIYISKKNKRKITPLVYSHEPAFDYTHSLLNRKRLCTIQTTVLVSVYFNCHMFVRRPVGSGRRTSAPWRTSAWRHSRSSTTASILTPHAPTNSGTTHQWWYVASFPTRWFRPKTVLSILWKCHFSHSFIIYGCPDLILMSDIGLILVKKQIPYHIGLI